jgi:hypothetical protein
MKVLVNAFSCVLPKTVKLAESRTDAVSDMTLAKSEFVKNNCDRPDPGGPG